jgi:hypothetical protein
VALSSLASPRARFGRAAGVDESLLGELALRVCFDWRCVSAPSFALVSS